MGMHGADLAFLLARVAIIALCLVAAFAALRRAGEPDGGWLRPRAMLVLAGLVLVVGAALALLDAWNTLVRHRDQTIELDSWLWLVFDLAVPVLTLWILRIMRQRDEAIGQLAAISMTDRLTGLANRHGFEALAIRTIIAARRTGQEVSLLMLDVDRFKLINDRFGHPAGDAVLRAVAVTLNAALRGNDVAGRWGGEEFAVLLPNTDPAGAVRFANRFRDLLRAEVPHPDPTLPVTTSGGIAAIGAAPPREALAAAIAEADAALYAAKQAGRDRVKLAAGDDNARPAMA